jgi:SAM-dependent methyltransferase
MAPAAENLGRPADPPETVAATYDRFYRQPNYFQYRDWLYRPFIRALIRAAGLQAGSRVLDVGCGQGFFTGLFAEAGLDALGADLSAEGVAQAARRYGASGAKFEVGDALRLPYPAAFDCVFTRSCSLYNFPDFAERREVTETLLGYVRPGGVLIFDYYTNLCVRKAGGSWRYHSLAEARRHFGAFAGSRVCFSMRLDTLLLGRHAFGLTGVNALASRVTGIGGELVAFVPKK